jgi:hypothetical protein
MPTEKLTVFIKEICLEYSELLYVSNKLMDELRELDIVKNCLNERYRKLNKICFQQEAEIKELKINKLNPINNLIIKSMGKNTENVDEYKFKLSNKENEFNMLKMDLENNKRYINELRENQDKLKAENYSMKNLFVKEIRTLKFDLENAIKQRDQLKNFLGDFKKQVNIYCNLK